MSNDSVNGCLYVGLIHFPVVNKAGETIGSAVTNLDLHDIARASRTFGVSNYFVITPYEEQRELVSEILAHWLSGSGGKANPDRREALSLIRICADFQEAIEQIEKKHGKEVLLIATCAGHQENTVTYQYVNEMLAVGKPVFILFGTAWGLAPELLNRVEGVLPPIIGSGGYNHLSVRSAVSIVLDRLRRIETI